MTCWLKLLLAFSPSARPTQINRMPNRLMPRNPSRPNSSIGKMPTTNTGSSGSSNNVSDGRDRMEKTLPVNGFGVGPITKAAYRSETRRNSAQLLAKSAGCHAGADFGAQFVDQLESFGGLDVPEGPAVAGARALSHRADAVN